MFMSQPVCFDNGEWKPYFDFIPPDETILRKIVSKAIQLSIEYDFGKRFKIGRKNQ